MKIGVFDSGLGGLVITKAFIESMPQYDYLYYGDSRHLSYGEKTSGRILSYTLAAMRRLIARDCKIIIIACNTAASEWRQPRPPSVRIFIRPSCIS